MCSPPPQQQGLVEGIWNGPPHAQSLCDVTVHTPRPPRVLSRLWIVQQCCRWNLPTPPQAPVTRPRMFSACMMLCGDATLN